MTPAIRSLRENPLVSAVAILSLSLGIGANAAIFALLSAVVLRPLPVREPDRLALVTTSAAREQYSYTTFEQIRSQSSFVEAAFAYTNCCGQAVLTSPGPTTLLERQYVSGDFFSALGTRPLHGRLLTAADDRRGAPEPVAVISYGLWRERFGAREDAIGAKIVLDRTPLTIVGVTPPDFFGVEVGRAFDILVPIRLAATLSRTPLGDDTPWLNVVVRLRSGVSIEQATAALRAAQPDIRRAAMPPNFQYKFLEQPLGLDPYSAGTSALRRRFSRPLEAIFAVVVLVLLIAAANIGNLLLARGTDRRHEIAIKTALGATRATLVREIVTEGLVLAGIGASYGVPIVAGHDFNEQDRKGSPSVMLVNEAFAKTFSPSPDRSIVGTTFSLAFRAPIGDYPWGTRTIVGIVGDTVYRSARDLPRPAISIPLSQYPGIIPQTTAYLGIRTAGAVMGAAASAQAIEDALRTVNGELAVTFQPLDRQISEAASEDRLIAHLSASFAILGLVLSALGIYGVTTYAAARQRRDYGIRIALGASTATIVRRVFARVALLVALGLIAGVAASLTGATLLRSLVFGIDARDPTILAVASAVLIGVALVAGLLPAYRASKTDPAVVLKDA